MPDCFLVEQAHGPEWDDSRNRRDQAGWDEHAAFIDGLAQEGVVVLGGPVGESTDENVVLVVALESEAEVRARFADDPWMDRVLTIESIRPWSVWIRAADGSSSPG